MVKLWNLQVRISFKMEHLGKWLIIKANDVYNWGIPKEAQFPKGNVSDAAKQGIDSMIKK